MSVDRRLVARTLGVALLDALAVALLYVFTVAYHNGGSAMVRIDAFGEADLELLLLIVVVMPLSSVAIALLVGDAKDT